MNDLVWNDGLAREASKAEYDSYTYNTFFGTITSNEAIGGYIPKNNGYLFKYPATAVEAGQAWNLTKYVEQIKRELSTFNTIS